jgi:MinD-like ATPase involved in chromosome partitioning or flagellar assembly
MVKEPKEKDVGKIISTVAENYLGLKLQTLGVVHYDNVLAKSINNMAKFLTERKDTIVSLNFYDIAGKIIKQPERRTPEVAGVTQVADTMK